MRRTTRLVTCLLCLSSLTGCLLPYCAYPTLDYTPAVKLDARRGEVRVFRVDINKPTADMSVFDGPVYERFTELPVSNTDEAPAQVKPSASYGFVVIGIALNYFTHTSHSLALRVYRPGYELVEIKSWEKVNRVIWKPSPDLDAQEKALDGLFPLDRLEAGSKSSAQRDAIDYGASEYERLATTAHTPDQRARLAEKAVEFRNRAKE